MPERFRITAGPFSEAQIAAVARMHAAEVPDGFLSSLGEPVLCLLYRHVAGSRLGVLLLAESEETGEPLGYVCAAVDTSALFTEFGRRRWASAVPLLVPRLMHPARARRMLETLAYGGSSDAGLPRAEIMNFVVVPSRRGLGVAAGLFEQLTVWFEARGVPAFKAVTGERQRRAHGFYEKSGCVPHGQTAIHRNQQSRIYIYTLPTAAGYAPSMEKAPRGTGGARRGTAGYDAVKRAMDIAVAAAVLAATSPVALAAAWRIKREDGGPILYRGTRIGRYGRPFAMLKFRSMVVDAARLGGPSTADDDPRLTATGRFLRRWKLDELPQMVNVLVGDMSLVGPRPQVPSDVRRYTADEMRLLDVRPGVTDWASIVFHDEGAILAGHADVDRAYDELIRPGKIALGLAYVENRGLGTDLRILALTALTLVGYRGAQELLRREVPLDLSHVRR
ncbi:GNAT family N-acetyltransferase [Actinoplanes sp. DH11]|uniref:GNAT family N-acetyltransferase n=1 Tax=Actinoplanes sp. DH11 TaxID=2857011 RepID=UPI001E5049F8|nr:GNAT family N-acetyltransferase [Actinoplanes sp. DH11]